jgi:hypothetical protein
MLYDPKHLDPDAVWRWYQTRGEATARNRRRTHGAQGPLRRALRPRWVDPTVPRNDAVIARVRTVIGSDSLRTACMGV